MVKPVLLKILFFLAPLLMVLPSEASHLVGGSMSYEYFGLQNNGKYRYRVTVFMYRDCYASTVPFDPDIEIGVYYNNSEKTLATTMTVPWVVMDRNVDPPSGGSDCDFKPNVCIKQAIYQGEVDLPSNTLGYHLVFRRCCRNTQVNIMNDMGQTFYAFIPNTAINNSSPAFTGVPSPYICRNDLVSMYNTAVEKNGDSLVYEMNIPWAGGSVGDAAPSAPFIMPAFEEVIYRQGFDETRPFGNQGIAEIDPRNGVTTLKAPATGLYSIAIDVTEYRNGVMVGKIRLDIQMIVINCPPNAVPELRTSTNTEEYIIVEGQTLCFDMIGSDADNHNLKLTASGDLFQGSNPASFTPKTGKGTVSSSFCWTPACGSASEVPKQVTFEVIDDGCPYKKKIINVSILVKPFTGTTLISGPSPVCSGAKGQVYSANGTPGSSYEWNVSGGIIVNGHGSNSITVDWDEGESGSITLTEVSQGGCRGNTGNALIPMLAAPPKPVISGPDSTCEFARARTYSTPLTANFTYSWTVDNGTIVAGGTSSQVSVDWGAMGTGALTVTQRNSLGCATESDPYQVALLRNEIDSLYGSPSVCPNVPGVEYRVMTPGPMATYLWTISGGTQSGGGSTSRITVDWGGTGMGSVQVIEVSKFGCLSDPVTLVVEKNHTLKGMMPIGPDTLCESSSSVKYEVIYTQGSTYYWGIQGGTFVSNDSSASVVVNWGNAGTGRITVYERSWDSVTNTPCLSSTQMLEVFLAPYPQPETISGRDELCQSTDPEPYTVNGFANSDYFWQFSGGPVQGQGESAITILPDQPGNFTLTVTETSEFGCAGPVNQKNILVHPRPLTEGIEGDSVICYPDYSGKQYGVTGFANSTYNWWIDGGDIITGQGSEVVTIDFTGQQLNTLNVQEISDFGCPGDTLSQEIFADNPSLDLKYISVFYGDDTKMELEWELLNAPRSDSLFEIQRRVAGSVDWKTTGQTDPGALYYVDPGIDADRFIYQYRILTENLCGDSILSEMHQNINLSGAKPEDDPYAVNVFWTNYQGWNQGVAQYQIYRKVGNNDYVIEDNAGLDTFGFYDDGTQTFRHCYRILAGEANGTEESWSNEICFTFEPILFVPNAFTPNGNGLNDQYSWFYASIRTFEISVYDRWGELIYFADSPDQYWNGVYRGEVVPDGVYAYIIRYTGHDGRPVTLKGNITVLH